MNKYNIYLKNGMSMFVEACYFYVEEGCILFKDPNDYIVAAFPTDGVVYATKHFTPASSEGENKQ